VLVLAGTACAKLLPSGPYGLLSSTSANFVALAELALAWSIVRFWNSWLPILAVIGVAILGAMVALTVSQPCGCMGPVTISRKTHFLLCMTLGFLACTVGAERLYGKASGNATLRAD